MYTQYQVKIHKYAFAANGEFYRENSIKSGYLARNKL